LGCGPKKLKKVSPAEIGAGREAQTAQDASSDAEQENEGKHAGMACVAGAGVLRLPAALAAYV